MPARSDLEAVSMRILESDKKKCYWSSVEIIFPTVDPEWAFHEKQEMQCYVKS